MAPPSPASPSGPRPRRGAIDPKRLGSLLAGLLIVGLVGLSVFGVVTGAERTWSAGATWVGESEHRPTPRPAARTEPLGTPLPPPARSGPHEFMATQPDSDEPVAYDPCRPISIVINPLRAPTGSTELLRSSLDRMSEITGFEFIVEGTTTEVPELPRPAYQPERYGDRWAPVLVIWASEDDVADLAGYGGLGGSSIAVAPGTSTHVYVSGVVVLNGPSIAQTLTWSRGWFLAEGLILHELGHLLGLDHVDDPGQLMHHDASLRDDFAAGDLAGLAALSSGPCVPEL